MIYQKRLSFNKQMIKRKTIALSHLWNAIQIFHSCQFTINYHVKNGRKAIFNMWFLQFFLFFLSFLFVSFIKQPHKLLRILCRSISYWTMQRAQKQKWSISPIQNMAFRQQLSRVMCHTWRKLKAIQKQGNGHNSTSVKWLNKQVSFMFRWSRCRVTFFFAQLLDTKLVVLHCGRRSSLWKKTMRS